MLYKDALETYFNNFKAALVFLLLLVFIIPFYYLGGTYLSASTLSLDYNFFSLPVMSIVALAIITILFLFFYSLFVVVINAAVKHEFSKIKINEYLNEKMQSLAFALFVVYSFITLLAGLIGYLLISAGVSVVFLNVLLLLVFLAFLFLPQIIVLDDEHLKEAMSKSITYAQTNVSAILTVIVAGIVLAIALALLEFVVDSYLFYGKYLTIIIALVFVVPYLEVLKSLIYLHKYDLIRHSQKMQHHRR